ncbi:MAG: chromate transporter [Clostridiales bacterium]|nr:chromate transporter [Clostridiales bacterium]
MKKLFYLFLTMFKIGLFTFGGGYAMIALLENEFVEKRKVMDKDEFVNMIAIGEASPGPIAINNATYIGYKISGLWGSLVATIAVCLPSLIIIYLISLVFETFLQIQLVSYAFKGIQVCVALLILSAGIKLFKDVEKKWYNYVVFVVVILLSVLFALFSIKFSVLYYILIGGVLGLIIYYIGIINSKRRSARLCEDDNNKEDRQ